PQRQLEPEEQAPHDQDQKTSEDVLQHDETLRSAQPPSSVGTSGCMRSTTLSVCESRPMRSTINRPSENNRKNSATQMAGKPSARPRFSLGRSGWTDSGRSLSSLRSASLTRRMIASSSSSPPRIAY